MSVDVFLHYLHYFIQRNRNRNRNRGRNRNRSRTSSRSRGSSVRSCPRRSNEELKEL